MESGKVVGPDVIPMMEIWRYLGGRAVDFVNGRHVER